MTPDLSIYLVTDAAQARGCGRTLVDTVRAAVAGGVTAVQIRDKHADARDMLELAAVLAADLPPRVALFINDRVDVFLAARLGGIRVTGVHVGQRDLPVATVRAMIGADAVLGLTANTPDAVQAAAASPARVDYLGIGTVRATRSKPDAPAALGIAGVGRLARASTLPAVAIGGIVAADLPALRAEGLAGAAVVSAICAAEDPRTAAAQLAAAWKAGT